ncbi:plasmid maintenance system killer protein [Microbacterium sp. MYb54]|nr:MULTISPECIES: type II toxin-antitoxin system RelE/ParE family toxin [unclassified Microbacterium]PQZ60130.1 plasmid maintenance system killer protein [Microbacterium sp. MYb43]PQZ79524.1 plasmid maintenance system killer protein [Microbacterium sp. MYb40]PRB23173.1 plasmid maintenance system killer protein [Microbacterium sp. MYb54]PRB27550.1 plasmid maintenance system killer protein [Microbacterium sp. MYb50]PRB65841.1 plasmid maintenance system killer protein [Microbacterium sp. MYb24]
MEVRYEDQKLKKLCTDEREMKRRRADIAPRLRLRIKALERAATLGDLPAEDPLGDWHPLTADRVGTWAGKLSANYRLIVSPESDGEAKDAVVVTVIEIADYH